MWNHKLCQLQGYIFRRSTASRPCCSTFTTSTTAATWLCSWHCSSNPSPWTKFSMWYKTWCKSRAFGRVVLLKSSFATLSYQTCSTWQSFNMIWHLIANLLPSFHHMHLHTHPFYDEIILTTYIYCQKRTLKDPSKYLDNYIGGLFLRWKILLVTT